MPKMPKIGEHTHCLSCGSKLTGQQRKFCRRSCKERYSYNLNPSYKRQRKRGIQRKLNLINLKGESCEICGYNKNLAVLTFHHLEPKDKSFDMTLTYIANCNWEKVLEEARKCQLLCHNCHHEIHHPECDMKKLLTDSNC